MLFGPGGVIPSTAGVQQGDPLGPLLFCLGLSAAVEAAAEGVDLLVHAWYLDDGLIFGCHDEVSKFIDRLETAAAAINLTLNRGKCEIIVPPSLSRVIPVSLSSIPSIRHADDWEILGVPIGTEDTLRRVSHAVATRISHQIEPFRLLPDPQVAYAMLRYCGTFPLGNYYARAIGAIGYSAFLEADESTFATLRHLGLDIDANAAARPPRLGGLGLRSLAHYAPVALIAATVSSRALLRFVVHQPSDPAVALWPVSALLRLRDHALEAALHSIRGQPSLFDAVSGHLDASYGYGDGQTRPPKHLQRTLSVLLDELVGPAASPSEAIRRNSAAAAHANSWLCPLPGADEPRWFAPSAFSPPPCRGTSPRLCDVRGGWHSRPLGTTFPRLLHRWPPLGSSQRCSRCHLPHRSRGGLGPPPRGLPLSVHAYSPSRYRPSPGPCSQSPAP